MRKRSLLSRCPTYIMLMASMKRRAVLNVKNKRKQKLDLLIDWMTSNFSCIPSNVTGTIFVVVGHNRYVSRE